MLRSHLEFIMTWGTAKKLPWDLVLLFGGGFALAAGAEQSGLATWIGSKMSALGGLNVVRDREKRAIG